MRRLSGRDTRKQKGQGLCQSGSEQEKDNWIIRGEINTGTIYKTGGRSQEKQQGTVKYPKDNNRSCHQSWACRDREGRMIIGTQRGEVYGESHVTGAAAFSKGALPSLCRPAGSEAGEYRPQPHFYLFLTFTFFTQLPRPPIGQTPQGAERWQLVDVSLQDNFPKQ